MIGYPRTIATKQDFINLLENENFRAQALADLQAIADLDDDTVQKATTLIDENDPEQGFNMETVENLNPVWKQKGFASRDEVQALIQEYGS